MAISLIESWYAMGAPSQSSAEKDFYTRRLIYSGNESLVESRCAHCGMVIIGSATRSLIADELEHMRRCSERSKTVPLAHLCNKVA